MLRQPVQVLIILFKRKDKEINFAVFERNNDKKTKQFISGGVDGNETITETAIRELSEEVNLFKESYELYKLDSKGDIPVSVYDETKNKDQYSWKDVSFVKEYSFAAEITNENFNIDLQGVLQSEHVNFSWLTKEKALGKLTHESNKEALKELYDRIETNTLKKAVEFSAEVIIKEINHDLSVQVTSRENINDINIFRNENNHISLPDNINFKIMNNKFIDYIINQPRANYNISILKEKNYYLITKISWKR